MRRAIVGAGFMLVLASCPDPQRTTPTRNGPMTDSAEPQQHKPGEWTIRVERTLGDASADGRVVLRRRELGHTRLAAARAWATLGRRLQAAAATADAITASRHGLDELGADYAARAALDDTALKLAAADDAIADGRHAAGVDILLRVLETRIRLYVERHTDLIIE
jgi:hypothetical protein